MNETNHDAWAAVASRDGRADGKFVFAVRTTRIYCRPSCPARRPNRENAAFFKTPDAAEAAGYRECRRCRPRSEGGPRAEAEMIRAAERLITERAGEPLRIAEIARELGVGPSKFSRLFARHAGTTPKKFATAKRFELFKKTARTAGVVESQYAAGFGSPSRLYAAASGHLGMSPGVWARGGKGATISYGFSKSPVGLMLIAFTERGVCAVELDETTNGLVKRLRNRFPEATLRHEQKAVHARVTHLDPHGTSFQLKVWNALRNIPAGKTKTYSEVAKAIGRPSAARAVARACATNPIALYIPCHRVVGASGALSGYRWGTERKRKMLELESASKNARRRVP